MRRVISFSQWNKTIALNVSTAQAWNNFLRMSPNRDIIGDTVFLTLFMSPIATPLGFPR
ncbi:MAG: hypothetical protein ACRCT1_01995 [Microcoleaceae cyanobacterium]